MQALPSPYGEATHQLQAGVERGECLSKVMSEMPDLFPPIYVSMIRAGELGGILEEILLRLKKILAREWSVASQHPSDESPLFLLLPAGKSLPDRWEAMSAYQQTVILSLFFETFGMLLESGVPIVQTMQTVATLLPQASRASWMKAIGLVDPDGNLFSPEMTRMEIFPDFAVELIRIGEERGSLHSMMHLLAESFEDDLEYQALHLVA